MPHRPRLYVEGIDDAHALRNLLWSKGWDEEAIGIQSERKSMSVGRLIVDPTGDPSRDESGNDDGVLRALRAGLPVAQYAIGIVLDADGDRRVAQRWDQVRGILDPLGMELPKEIDPEGYVGVYIDGTLRVNVGVWLMPDNRREGGIEAFLADLAGADNPVLRHARASTQSLIDAYPDIIPKSKRKKAELRAFLAWQKEPGCAYGVAIRKRYFDGDPTAAQAFVAWFARVYGPPPPS